MADGTYQPKTYREQGGDRHVIASGGSLDVESGGELDIESGGALKLAGTAVTATAADLNQGAGAAAASLLTWRCPAAVDQAIDANGAITLTEYNTAITSVNSTGQAFTLADATIAGHVKRIQLIVDGGDATVTFNTDATLVFADVGDVAEVMWDGSAWVPIALYNIVDGATGPAYTPAS
jgi:hypothetical protein